MRERFARRIQLVSIAFLAAVAMFGYGLAVARYEIWPFDLIQQTRQAAASLSEFGELVPAGRRVLAPAGAARERLTLHDPDRVAEGYYAFLGMDDEKQLYSARLYNHRGKQLHAWEVHYEALDADGPSTGVSSPHAFAVLPDGSIMLGFDNGDVVARIDTCGVPMWTQPGIYHHAMTRADDGSYWAWRAEGTHYAQYHYLVNFDPETGETRRKIGLIEDVIRRMGPAASIFGVRPDYPFVHFERDPENPSATDLFHPNDLDVLSADVAGAFPTFEAGDLLLSFRELDLVTVLDPDTHAIKWWQRGPWIKQHDPDFTADGYISVYANNTQRHRSEILKVHPETGEIVNELFHGELEFYSAAMGKHQYLPNGNVLIVVPGEGRILEVTEDGDYVLEYNNLARPELAGYNEHVEDGVWVPPDFFDALPRCST